ncbi:MAG TPA: DUF3943 domain-containing protein [Kofleriaceae bacterium]|jgi:hypothetical protein
MRQPPRWIAGLVAGTLACGVASSTAHADDATPPVIKTPDPGEDHQVHWVTTLVFAALKFGASAAYYWSTQGQQEVDWVYPSWADKFSLRAVRFDTNPFYVNAVRHPITGAADYLDARSNNFGVLGSLAFTFGTGFMWEYFVETYEDPAINDLIMNPVGGIGIGEPLYQIGQLWRGGELSYADRARTLLFSPYDAVQDVWRKHAWYRPKAYADFKFSAGPAAHFMSQAQRAELGFALDFDVIRHPGYVEPGAHTDELPTGAWTRLQYEQRFGYAGEGLQSVSSKFHSQTTLVGYYKQDDDGVGEMIAPSVGYTFRHERLAHEWDKLVIGHLFGPQAQLSWRKSGYAIRWDAAAYVDFAMVQAHVFGPVSPLPAPPPLLSTLQAEGYYDAGALSAMSRLRLDAGPWHADAEVWAHQFWSLDFADRAEVNEQVQVRTTTGTVAIPAEPHGTQDERVFAHVDLGYRDRIWGVEGVFDAAYRRGQWESLSRDDWDYSLGVNATANF